MEHIRQKCDFCKEPAAYDSKIIGRSSWAFMCKRHYLIYGVTIKGLYTVLEKPIPLTKVCSQCGKSQDISEYYPYTDSQGVQRTRNECKVCYAANRRATDLRRDKKC